MDLTMTLRRGLSITLLIVVFPYLSRRVWRGVHSHCHASDAAPRAE